MNSLMLKKLGALALVALFVTACGPPPKVMVDQAFMGDKRTVKMLMQRNASGTFDQGLRVCTIEKGQETQCKDTLVLENVTPGSLY